MKLNKVHQRRYCIIMDNDNLSLIRFLYDLQINGEMLFVHGEYGPSLCTVAKENHADYVVVGCRGRGSVTKLIKGSVTDYVAHHSSVPVVIARHRDVTRKNSLIG